jgi:hypothetical protein
VAWNLGQRESELLEELTVLGGQAERIGLKHAVTAIYDALRA